MEISVEDVTVRRALRRFASCNQRNAGVRFGIESPNDIRRSREPVTLFACHGSACDFKSLLTQCLPEGRPIEELLKGGCLIPALQGVKKLARGFEPRTC